jgi:hypothetical protein
VTRPETPREAVVWGAILNVTTEEDRYGGTLDADAFLTDLRGEGWDVVPIPADVATLAVEFPYGDRYVYSRTVGGQDTILTVIGWQYPDLVVSLATYPDDSTSYGDVKADVMRRLPRPTP